MEKRSTKRNKKNRKTKNKKLVGYYINNGRIKILYEKKSNVFNG